MTTGNMPTYLLYIVAQGTADKGGTRHGWKMMIKLDLEVYAEVEIVRDGTEIPKLSEERDAWAVFAAGCVVEEGSG
jgi:hypothetical protein